MKERTITERQNSFQKNQKWMWKDNVLFIKVSF